MRHLWPQPRPHSIWPRPRPQLSQVPRLNTHTRRRWWAMLSGSSFERGRQTRYTAASERLQRASERTPPGRSSEAAPPQPCTSPAVSINQSINQSIYLSIYLSINQSITNHVCIRYNENCKHTRTFQDFWKLPNFLSQFVLDSRIPVR